MCLDKSSVDFDVGMRVLVNKSYRSRSRNQVGSIGTVKGVYANNIAVALDNMYNTRSGYGYYYFEPTELIVIGEPETKTETIMEENNMQKITTHINIAKVRCLYSNQIYMCANFEQLSVGDLCVVKLNQRLYFDIAEVIEIVERNDIDVYDEVVAKVDTSYYDERVANREKAAELRAKMEARAKQLQDIALYQMLAEKDQDMMDLLAEYQAIPKM